MLPSASTQGPQGGQLLPLLPPKTHVPGGREENQGSKHPAEPRPGKLGIHWDPLRGADSTWVTTQPLQPTLLGGGGGVWLAVFASHLGCTRRGWVEWVGG